MIGPAISLIYDTAKKYPLYLPTDLLCANPET
jgi:hypothetical protein